MDDLQWVQKIAVWALPVLLAITVHEVAHGWVAKRYGDDTAARAGRLSLNPLRHVDPVGTLLVPAVLLVLGGFLFGWAKPVPVDFSRLRNPRRDMALVAVAGPAVNGLMALGWALLLRLSLETGEGGAAMPWLYLRYVALAGISINLVLMVLNLLPIPPLDGGRVLVGLLPLRLARPLARLEPWGLLILLGLMFSGLLSALLYWPLLLGEGLLLKLVRINPSLLY